MHMSHASMSITRSVLGKLLWQASRHALRQGAPALLQTQEWAMASDGAATLISSIPGIKRHVCCSRAGSPRLCKPV